MQARASMQIEFTVNWGYTMVYSRRQYHPTYCWDGRLECIDGKISGIWQLEYPVTWLGAPVNSAREARLTEPSWQSVTRRNVAGIRVSAEGDEKTAFILHTKQGTFEFSGQDILSKGRLVFHVGWKYSRCSVIVNRRGHYWFRPEQQPSERVVEAADFKGGEQVSWARMPQVWISPGHSAEFDIDLPSIGADEEQTWLIHVQAMTAGKSRPSGPVDNDRANLQFGNNILSDDTSAESIIAGKFAPEEPATAGYVPVEIREGKKCLDSFKYYLRNHDYIVQLMHDIWREIPAGVLPAGTHTLKIVNRHTQLPLLVHRLTIRPCGRRHLDMSAPQWAMVGEKTCVRLRLLGESTPVRISFDRKLFRLTQPSSTELTLPKGVHEIWLLPLKPAVNTEIIVEDLNKGQVSRAEIGAVYSLPPEEAEVKVGYDMTTVVHDDTGEMDWILDYTSRTQLANLVVFRPFNPIALDSELWKRWARFCASHGIYFQATNAADFSPPEELGKYYCGRGGHEVSGTVYAFDPDNRSRNMKQAAERFMDYIRRAVTEARRTVPGVPVSFGDASGGHRYSLLSGADLLRSETMVGHTTLLLSQSRPAAAALGSGEWGVHIAMHHYEQPGLESHLREYYLSLMQAWIMGALFMYEEDSLFMLFKEERQGWDDRLARGKREMTRDFLRFVATHPRTGKPQVLIASLLGRYAAPFSGMTCGHEQDPSYAVWGKYGRTDPAWSHRTPEKGMHLLDILMPGAAMLPMRQQFERRRFFFSGSPYGDFDQVPIEAGPDFLSHYKLLMLLGWNTMIAEDYEKLWTYVESGGTLFLSVPHLSTHTSRDFLLNMIDLALYAEGDVAGLCGIRILGKGEPYSGSWSAAGSEFAEASCPELSRAPNTSADEDGSCHLADIELRGAKPVIVDALSSKPLVVSHELGKGRVYVLTAWAYPGHEELSDLCGAVIRDLCRRHRGPVQVDDESGEVFWTHWPQDESSGKVMLLNTDWTLAGNKKSVTLRLADRQYPLQVGEGEILVVTYLSWCLIEPCSSQLHIEVESQDAASAILVMHGTGRQRFVVHSDAENVRVSGGGRLLPAHKTAAGCWEVVIEFLNSTRMEVKTGISGNK